MPFARNRAVFAFGGNLPSEIGSVNETISAAFDELRTHGVEVIDQSRFFQTPCFPAGAGPDYVNLVAVTSTSHSPKALLERLHEIEAKFGRARDSRWAGRTLDVDILSYENLIIPDLDTYQHWVDLPLDVQMKEAPQNLILPHPRIQDRGFVLIPLCDVWPEWTHPVSGKTAQMLCDSLPISETRGIKPL
ncbi:2-amino-4-hydroxy-6-hydroxymethyldihydropteridine diphosphokinase [Pacificibacter marinus]|uniref:2-amino-4-hydroxy-6- hydroxymethyldihydropteridine diphosphokinase n=1 Tax=Pacificibacter marinus TaxID=658057 RepID=UPI001C07A1C2|nr:2-amino-4-hydroxy-6-hydroxymethyldihydropteridine diphosphokinase [Pacificibacter marinus]MBU2866211.1 2-amino-4-hydroxy-6-hydroxymethyldihydropteridine diphosphokinase [Pacificibacter marinus]